MSRPALFKSLARRLRPVGRLAFITAAVAVGVAAGGMVLVLAAERALGRPILGIRATAAALSSLSGLTDVTLSSPQDGDALSYDTGAGKWINAALAGGGGGIVVDSGLVTANSNVIDQSVTGPGTLILSANSQASGACYMTAWASVGGTYCGSDISIYYDSAITQQANLGCVVQIPSGSTGIHMEVFNNCATPSLRLGYVVVADP